MNDANILMSKMESANTDSDGDSNHNGQLLRHIEAISKALYLHKTPHNRASTSSSGVRSKSVERPRLPESRSTLDSRILNERLSYKEKKSSSVWNWKKPLKALAHIRDRKFNICFFFYVHSIEGLPPSFNGISLSVHWKRKDEVLRSHPSKVTNGVAEFDETLTHKCYVYGSRSGPQHSAKYEVKLFMVYPSVVGSPAIDMGKQLVDLTRLLPLTLEELEGEKSTGKWTTSFKLSGKAKGAILNVSFGFSVVRDNLMQTRSNIIASNLLNRTHNRSYVVESETGFGPINCNGMLRRVGSVPSSLNRGSSLSSQPAVAKICDELAPNLGLELSKSIEFLYQKLNEANWCGSKELKASSEYAEPLKPKPAMELDSDKDTTGYEYDGTEFTIIEQGIEMSTKEEVESRQGAVKDLESSGIETIDVKEIIEDDDVSLAEEIEFQTEDKIFDGCAGGALADDRRHKENGICKEASTMEDLESAFHSFLISEYANLETPRIMGQYVEDENYMDTEFHSEANTALKRSVSLDEITQSVASDFFNMLGIERSPFVLSLDSDPESPRERLLREFEKEALASGNLFVECDADGEHEEMGCFASESRSGDSSKGFDFSLDIQAAEEEHHRASQLLSRRRKAKVLEDLETEVLMREWGLNEEAFQNSPCYCSDGFGSPVELPPEEKVQLPPLGEGFGPFVWTKDGGFLRSMRPSLFRNSKNVGSLIMQASRPIVLPAEMGADIMDILQHLASIGIERLSLQAKELMPLEDITGKTVEQIAREAHRVSLPDRQASLPLDSLPGQDTTSGRKEVEGSYSGEFDYMKSCFVRMGMGTGYVTLEDLAPLAMDWIECISFEGLRIQSGMSEAAPSSINPQYVGKIQSFDWKIGNSGGFLSLEGPPEMRLDETDGGNNFDGLLYLSITLDEWSRLDAGITGDKDQVSERTRRILAAHHAKSVAYVGGSLTRDNEWEHASSTKHGLLGNNLIIAFMVLLRDPFRNYEPVGTPMLAIVQVERAFLHAEPTVYGTTLGRSSIEERDDAWMMKDEMGKEKNGERKESSTGFEILEVNLCGLKTEPAKLQFWGTKMQLQSGTRWLLASGMSKSIKHQVSKSKAIVVSYPQRMTKAQTDSLWSISSNTNGRHTNWNALEGSVPFIRNPDIIFPK